MYWKEDQSIVWIFPFTGLAILREMSSRAMKYRKWNGVALPEGQPYRRLPGLLIPNFFILEVSVEEFTFNNSAAPPGPYTFQPHFCSANRI